MKMLVTGAAGFIGFHSISRLATQGHEIVGVDNLNGYYDVNLKLSRLEKLNEVNSFRFSKMDLADRSEIASLFSVEKFDVVLHLGAQAGVRYSIDNPHAYADSNLLGTLNVLEGCRHTSVKHLVYASSSSVYGSNKKIPFSVDDNVDHPVSLYAATKKANELMCHTYAHLYNLHATGLRFFTVYGPWGRPDMAYFKFAEAISAGKAIDVYNFGDMQRDFTYIDDIVDGIEAIIKSPPPYEETAVPHTVYNLGHNHPEQLLEMIEILEKLMGKSAIKNFLPMQPGDVYSTYADIDPMKRDYGYAPKVGLRSGLEKFVEWYESYSSAKS